MAELPIPTLLIVGKTGSGKSSTANTIFGKNVFTPAHSINSHDSKKARKEKGISIVRAPDPRHKRFQGHMHTKEDDEVGSWLDEIEGESYAIVYVIRCDKRFTREDYDLYQLLKNNEKLKTTMQNKMVLVFTFGDKLFGRDLRQDLVSDNPYLMTIQEMLSDAGGRYLVFDNTAENRKAVQAKALIKVVETTRPHPFPQHVCRLLIVANTTERGEIMKRLSHKTRGYRNQTYQTYQTYQMAMLLEIVEGLFIEITFVEEHPQASDTLKRAVKVAISPGPHAICASTEQSEFVSQLLGSSADNLDQYNIRGGSSQPLAGEAMDQEVDWNDFPKDILKRIVELKERAENDQRGIFFQNEELKKIDAEIHDEIERKVKGRWHSIQATLGLSGSPYEKRLRIKEQRTSGG